MAGRCHGRHAYFAVLTALLVSAVAQGLSPLTPPLPGATAPSPAWPAPASPASPQPPDSPSVPAPPPRPAPPPALPAGTIRAPDFSAHVSPPGYTNNTYASARALAAIRAGLQGRTIRVSVGTGTVAASRPAPNNFLRVLSPAAE